VQCLEPISNEPGQVRMSLPLLGSMGLVVVGPARDSMGVGQLSCYNLPHGSY